MRILFALLLILPATSVTAQHWCDRANADRLNATENAICRTPQIKSLDMEMESAFYTLRDSLVGAKRERLVNEQRKSWLPYRNACDRDRSCIIAVYVERISELNHWGQPPGNTRPAVDVVITPDGKIETPHASGGVAVFDPATGQHYTRLPDGSTIGAAPLQVNPIGLPELPGAHAAQSRFVAQDMKFLTGALLSDSQFFALEEHEPDDFLDFMDFYINAVLYLQGLSQ